MADRPRPPRGPLSQQAPRPPRGPLGVDGHEDHDPLLIAAYASGDVVDGATRDAARIVAECAGCAQLAADLQAIAAATASAPTPPRPRSFHIAPEQARRLRPRGLRGLLTFLAAPKSVLPPRLGVAFTTLGVAGLLLASIPGANFSGSAAPHFTTTEDRSVAAEQASPGTELPPAYEPAQGAPGAAGGEGPPEGMGRGDDLAGESKSRVLNAPPRDPADRLPLVALSSVLLVSGLSILALRRTARGAGR